MLQQSSSVVKSMMCVDVIFSQILLIKLLLLQVIEEADGSLPVAGTHMDQIL